MPQVIVAMMLAAVTAGQFWSAYSNYATGWRRQALIETVGGGINVFLAIMLWAGGFWS